MRNLTVVLEGRILTRADRVNDTAIGNAGSVASASETALLAATVGNGALIEDVTLCLRHGAEVQGAVKTALCAASVWAPANGSATLRRVIVRHEGTLRAYADTSGGTAFDPTNAAVGTLVGWLGGPTGAEITLSDCTVALGPGAVVSAETGTASSVGGCVGNLNNATPVLSGLTLTWSAGAEISGKEATATTPMPWIASYASAMATATVSASGRILAPAAFPWSDWWLKAQAPLRRPGYTFFLK